MGSVLFFIMNNYILAQYQLAEKTIYVVENHHHVLVPWYQEYIRNPQQLPLVLTLDHHTDSLPAFRHEVQQQNPTLSLEEQTAAEKKLTQFYGQHFAQKTDECLNTLRHDEHISFALQNHWIQHSIIISHENFSIDVHPDILILCETPYSEDPMQQLPFYEKSLETHFLQHHLNQAPQELKQFIQAGNFILDIDLDYFKSCRSISPENATLFFQLIAKCRCITISMERTWVRLLNMDYEKKEADYFLKHLLELISQATHMPLHKQEDIDMPTNPICFGQK